MERNFKVTFSGNRSSSDPFKDGQMQINFWYTFSGPEIDLAKTEDMIITSSAEDETNLYKIPYHKIFGSGANPEEGQPNAFVNHPIMMNYVPDFTYGIDVDDTQTGLTATSADSEEGSQYTFYRREYRKYVQDNYYDRTSNREIDGAAGAPQYEFIGEWEPVAVAFSRSVFRDFNIKAGHSYQYILYPNSIMSKQLFANGEEGTAQVYGKPVEINYDDWNIVELIPENNAVDAPILKKTYRANVNNMWFFKYNLDVGAQKQNFTKTQIQTLGKYTKISHGAQNNVSGSVSCYMGSEIVPYSREGYVERMRRSITHPLSTNEKAFMLQQWRKFAFSSNPKLLRDPKGQSWIVTILSDQNTPNMNYYNYPDRISFDWVEIESTDNVVIYGDSSGLPTPGKCNSIWNPKIIH